MKREEALQTRCVEVRSCHKFRQRHLGHIELDGGYYCQYCLIEVEERR